MFSVHETLDSILSRWIKKIAEKEKAKKVVIFIWHMSTVILSVSKHFILPCPTDREWSGQQNIDFTF